MAVDAQNGHFEIFGLAMLFIMAVLVGTVVIGMLLPIFNLQELIR